MATEFCRGSPLEAEERRRWEGADGERGGTSGESIDTRNFQIAVRSCYSRFYTQSAARVLVLSSESCLLNSFFILASYSGRLTGHWSGVLLYSSLGTESANSDEVLVPLEFRKHLDRVPRFSVACSGIRIQRGRLTIRKEDPLI